MEFVEIGGIKWATCNVGAEKPTDTGLYFQWGDRKGYTADEAGKTKMFVLNHYKHHNGSRWTKYTKFDGKLVLNLCDDAAFAYMGQGWRMPTKEEFKCLAENTTHMWVNNYKDSGVAGMVFTDRTDKSKELFFPAAGNCIGDKVSYVGIVGFYWSSSLQSGRVYNAYQLYYRSDYTYLDGYDHRCIGCPIRGILTV